MGQLTSDNNKLKPQQVKSHPVGELATLSVITLLALFLIIWRSDLGSIVFWTTSIVSLALGLLIPWITSLLPWKLWARILGAVMFFIPPYAFAIVAGQWPALRQGLYAFFIYPVTAWWYLWFLMRRRNRRT